MAAVAVAVAGGDEAPAPAQIAATEPEAGADAAEIPARHKSGLCRKLRCTVEQDEPVYQLISDHREQAKARAKEASTARRKIAELYAADELDDEAIRGVYGEIAESDGQVQLHAYESLVTLHSLLSPEQREILGGLLARLPPEQVLGKTGGGDEPGPRGARARRGDRATPADPEARAARAEAMRARREAGGTKEGGRGDPRRAATIRRRDVAVPAADDGGLK